MQYALLTDIFTTSHWMHVDRITRCNFNPNHTINELNKRHIFLLQIKRCKHLGTKDACSPSMTEEQKLCHAKKDRL